MTIGYTAGVYDLFHIGHLTLLKNCKGLCDKLIVGVTVDELVLYKGKKALIPFEDRIEIVRSCKYVDAAVPQYDMDKLAMCKKLGASVLFVGDDWYGTDKWQEYEKQFNDAGIKIIYFPYTKGVSSTLINKTLTEARENRIKRENNMTDKNFCMSSYLAFRYIEKDGVEFADGLCHKTSKLPQEKDLRIVSSTNDIEKYLISDFKNLAKNEKLGILLSGGMDSACLASFMPKGSDAYTFRFEGGKYAEDELKRAENFAKINGLTLHYVDINWNDVKSCLHKIMQNKGAPVHSIEPQIYLAALQAQKDGVTKMVIGDAADYVFYGMNGLLSQDWRFEDFVNRSIYIKPENVLVNPSDVLYLYERYRLPDDKIDFLGFYDKSITEESYSSYENAFETAGMSFVDPYENFKMSEKVDLNRIRNGESKYFIRALFKKRYPNVTLPEKSPMPRPVDFYFRDWKGPTRPEFKENLDMSKFTGNQKWQLWCLEEFLNMIESGSMNTIRRGGGGHSKLFFTSFFKRTDYFCQTKSSKEAFRLNSVCNAKFA